MQKSSSQRKLLASKKNLKKESIAIQDLEVES
jgi:hypothetical protein